MKPVRLFLSLLFVAGAIAATILLMPGLTGIDMKYGLYELLPLLAIEDEAIPDHSVGVSEANISTAHPSSAESDSIANVISSTTERNETVGPVDDMSATETSYIASQITPILLSKSNEKESSLRIMFFGDSQLEGDRITAYIRKELRKIYGGTGPGLLQPLMPVMYTRTAEIRSSSNWKRYNYLSYLDGDLQHTTIAPFMSLCRFLPPDSISDVTETASVQIKPSLFADTNASRYDNLRLFYGNLRGECVVTISSDSRVISSDTLRQGSGPYEYTCYTNGVSDLQMLFRGNASPDVLAFSLESDTGVVVDNIPHRGSAGLEFTMADRRGMANLLSMISPDLIVLHYGLNVVRNVREEYLFYQRGLERQIELLKEISPESAILIMGLTDMAGAEAGTESSFPNIGVIRDAQRAAAISTKTGFWDTYEAMGGKNSAIRWAGADPPLLQKDYTHLSYAGADSVAAMLLSELIPRQEEETEMDVLNESFIAGDISDSNEQYSRKVLAEQPAMLLKSIFTYHPDRPFIFTNIAFWVFFLVLMAVYSLVYKRRFIRNFYLFVISLFFYYKSGEFFLFLLIVSTITDYTAGRAIYACRKSIYRKIWLVISIVVNIGMLAYFKYSAFFIETINELAGTSFPVVDVLAMISNDIFGTSFNVSAIILPVGISFFTFQTISYTVDVYRGTVKPVRNIIDFGFYVSFFPQLVAGPIVRASEFVPQLYDKFRLTRREFSHALFIIAKGLVKKMIISDYISVNFVDRVFAAPELYSGTENLMAVYGYGLQIYCDFSGYTDIAIGVALLTGFRLPVNFNSPYKAVGLSDFWRRWHISLSRWLRDYLYIPLGGSRKGKVRTGVNILITMVLGGLWHGASLNFLLWGAIHGLGLLLTRALYMLFPLNVRRRSLYSLIQIFLTFNFVSFAWIFFRTASSGEAMLMIKRIGEGVSLDNISGLWTASAGVVVLLAAGYILHFLPEKVKEAVRGLFVRSALSLQLIAMVLLALVLIHMQNTGIQPFIYFRF